MLSRFFDSFFKLFGNFIFDPIRAALFTDQGWNIPHNNHSETEIGSKGGFTPDFLPAANGTNIIGYHGFLRVL